MTDDTMQQAGEIKFDVTNLYREDQITDLKVGSIQRLIPIKADGTDDESREILYTGHAQMMSQMGAVPIQSPIEAASLEEAVEKYPEAIQQGIENLMEEVQRRQREEANKIVTPGSIGGGGGGGNLII